MLPGILCEELCSLNPGIERLTFSVVWQMDDDGNILNEWFGRSVIKSCVKLAYEHAQVNFILFHKFTSLIYHYLFITVLYLNISIITSGLYK